MDKLTQEEFNALEDNYNKKRLREPDFNPRQWQFLICIVIVIFIAMLLYIMHKQNINDNHLKMTYDMCVNVTKLAR